MAEPPFEDPSGIRTHLLSAQDVRLDFVEEPKQIAWDDATVVEVHGHEAHGRTQADCGGRV
jgi:hypothetical protein